MRFVLICAVLFVGGTGSGSLPSGRRAARQRPPDFSRGLVVAAHAEGVRYTIREAGVQELGYEIGEEYPATRTLTEIRARLQRQGWKPLDEDLLNPGSPAIRDWGAAVDATVNPQRTFHTWSGQWRDGHANLLFYSLRYDCPLDDHVHASRVTVSAAFWPRDVVEFAQREARKRRP